MSSIKQLNARGYAVWPGVRVKTINGEIDTDHLGAERETPPGSVGWLDSINCVDNEGVISFCVHFDNGAAIVLTRAEMDESAKYQLLSPLTIRQLALYLRHGFKVADLTIYDDAAYFSDRGRLFQRDRGRRFSAIVDAQGCAQARV